MLLHPPSVVLSKQQISLDSSQAKLFGDSQVIYHECLLLEVLFWAITLLSSIEVMEAFWNVLWSWQLSHASNSTAEYENFCEGIKQIDIYIYIYIYISLQKNPTSCMNAWSTKDQVYFRFIFLDIFIASSTSFHNYKIISI